MPILPQKSLLSIADRVYASLRSSFSMHRGLWIALISGIGMGLAPAPGESLGFGLGGAGAAVDFGAGSSPIAAPSDRLRASLGDWIPRLGTLLGAWTASAHLDGRSLAS